MPPRMCASDTQVPYYMQVGRAFLRGEGKSTRRDNVCKVSSHLVCPRAVIAAMYLAPEEAPATSTTRSGLPDGSCLCLCCES